MFLKLVLCAVQLIKSTLRLFELQLIRADFLYPTHPLPTKFALRVLTVRLLLLRPRTKDTKNNGDVTFTAFAAKSSATGLCDARFSFYVSELINIAEVSFRSRLHLRTCKGSHVSKEIRPYSSLRATRSQNATESYASPANFTRRRHAAGVLSTIHVTGGEHPTTSAEACIATEPHAWYATNTHAVPQYVHEQHFATRSTSPAASACSEIVNI